MSLKILVADDEKTSLTVITMILKKRGYTYMTANDGLEALDLAKNNFFDLIITDIMMPGIEGIELIDEIMLFNPTVKIIAVSAEGQAGFTDFLTLAKTVGASASLAKPFSSDQLLDVIDTVMGVQSAQAAKF